MSEETKIKKPRAPKAPAPVIKLRPGLPKKANDPNAVDWRKIVSPENLILAWNYWAKQGKDINTLEPHEVEELKEKCPDEGLIIRKAGFGEIAAFRGVKSTEFPIVDSYPDRAMVVAKLVLVPTEDEPYEVVISGVANCSQDNSDGEFSKHCEAMASNRAINRAWRTYMNISAVSYDELNPKEKMEEVATSSPVPQQTLKSQMDELGITVADLVEIIQEKGYSFGKKLKGDLGYEPWDENLFSLSGPACFSLITDIKNYAKRDMKTP